MIFRKKHNDFMRKALFAFLEPLMLNGGLNHSWSHGRRIDSHPAYPGVMEWPVLFGVRLNQYVRN